MVHLGFSSTKQYLRIARRKNFKGAANRAFKTCYIYPLSACTFGTKKRSSCTFLGSLTACRKLLFRQAEATDNADAYRWFLTHYCAVSSHFKEILPYGVSALVSALVFLAFYQFIQPKSLLNISLNH